MTKGVQTRYYWVIMENQSTRVGQMEKGLMGTDSLLLLLDIRGTAVVVLVCRRFPGLYCVVFVFQLSCCGKGIGTNLLTQLTDRTGITNICPSNTFTVSTIIYFSGLIFARMLLAHGENKQDHHLALCRNHEVSQKSSINFAVRHFLSAVYLHQANAGGGVIHVCVLSHHQEHEPLGTTRCIDSIGGFSCAAVK